MNEVAYIFKKFGHIIVGVIKMISKEKFFFLLPICLMLALLAFLVYYIGPGVIVSFIYAGV